MVLQIDVYSYTSHHNQKSLLTNSTAEWRLWKCSTADFFLSGLFKGPLVAE